MAIKSHVTVSLLGGTNSRRNDAALGRVVLHMSLCRRGYVDDASNFLFSSFYMCLFAFFVLFFFLSRKRRNPHFFLKICCR